MKKRRLAWILTFLLFTGTARADVSPEQIATNLRATVVGITVGSNAPPLLEERTDETAVTPLRFTHEGRAIGSGLIISADGLILTTETLFEQAGDILVVLEGGITKKAELVGKDKRTNLALIRIKGPTPSFATLSNRSLPALGERIIAISRTTLENESFPVLSEGIVSGVSEVPRFSMPFFQTTVQLQPGTAGSPLVSQKSGGVIGINSHSYVNQSKAVAIGFPIPIQTFLRYKDQLITKGKIAHAVIGITTSAMNEQLRLMLGLGAQKGVLIASVRDGGAAERAGLREGDVALAVDSTPTPSVEALFDAIGARDPGEDLQLTVFRKGKAITLKVTREALSDK